ncbi:MAG: acyl-CoA dehydrogenase family protein [Caulobacteraceae bacterium]
MDFNDTPDEAAYRAKAKAWLEANAPKGRMLDEEDPAGLKQAKAWQAKKAAAGYACITWPKEWGGVGGANWQAQVFAQ